jgi:hypothetical protein
MFSTSSPSRPRWDPGATRRRKGCRWCHSIQSTNHVLHVVERVFCLERTPTTISVAVKLRTASRRTVLSGMRSDQYWTRIVSHRVTRGRLGIEIHGGLPVPTSLQSIRIVHDETPSQRSPAVWPVRSQRLAVSQDSIPKGSHAGPAGLVWLPLTTT